MIIRHSEQAACAISNQRDIPAVGQQITVGDNISASSLAIWITGSDALRQRQAFILGSGRGLAFWNESTAAEPTFVIEWAVAVFVTLPLSTSACVTV